MKFAFIQWVGEDVKPMSKAKISTHKSEIEKVFVSSYTYWQVVVLSAVVDSVCET